MCQHSGFWDVIELIGKDAALALVSRFGGTTVQIPAESKPGGLYDDLSTLIGERDARRLIHTYARLPLYIPRLSAARRAARDTAIQQRFDALTSAGMSARKAVPILSREFDLADSSIWRALKRSPQPT